MIRFTAMMGVALVGCAEDPVLSFDYVLALDEGGIRVDVDDAPYAGELRYTFATYEEARSELSIPITVYRDDNSYMTTITPGECAKFVPDLSAIGTITEERVSYVVFGLEVTPNGFRCLGTDGSVTATP